MRRLRTHCTMYVTLPGQSFPGHSMTFITCTYTHCTMLHSQALFTACLLPYCTHTTVLCSHSYPGLILLALNHSGVLIKIGELVVTACLITWSITHRQFNWDGKASKLNQKDCHFKSHASMIVKTGCINTLCSTLLTRCMPSAYPFSLMTQASCMLLPGSVWVKDP